MPLRTDALRTTTGQIARLSQCGDRAPDYYLPGGREAATSDCIGIDFVNMEQFACFVRACGRRSLCCAFVYTVATVDGAGVW